MRTKTHAQKISWLRKNKIVLKKEKIRPSTVNRLYSFYHRNPLSTPRNLAYGYPERLEKKIMRYGAKAVIRTPKGKITGKQYVRSRAKSSQKEVRDLLPGYITPKFGMYYSKVKHVRDEFIYIIKPRIISTRTNKRQTLRKLQSVVIPDIVFYLSIFLEKRAYLYKHHDIGALLHYDTSNFTTASGVENPSGYTRMPWITVYNNDMVAEALFEAFQGALHIFDTVSGKASRGATIELFRVDIYISTKEKATTFDELRKGL